MFQELGIRHSLHRKKLQLAIQAMISGNLNKAGELDHAWVMSKYFCGISKNISLSFVTQKETAVSYTGYDFREPEQSRGVRSCMGYE